MPGTPQQGGKEGRNRDPTIRPHTAVKGDSVSQTMFSILLTTRAAQLLLERDPARVRAQLVQLQELVQSALAEMRSLITQLRIKAD
jgi:hypothetical protein